MEFEDMSERVQWEARRVAAAFGVEDWHRHERDSPSEFSGPYAFEGRHEDVSFEWTQNAAGVSFIAVFQSKDDPCLIGLDEGLLMCSGNAIPNRLMVRGLYRLGLEDNGTHEESILVGLNREFNCELSAHEKLELRLSMPREFWPKAWLDENGE